MIASKAIPRCISIAQRARQRPGGSGLLQKRCFRSANRSRVAVAGRSSPKPRTAGLLLSLTVGGGFLYALGYPRSLHAEVIPAPAEVKFEEPRRKASSREDNRDLISSQHLQVKKSWENPGVYCWGSNSGKLIYDSDEPNIKLPRRLPFFDGKLLRDLKLDRNFGAAITENGDLLQWGTGYSASTLEPTPTLRGKDLVKLAISRDRILALSSRGQVYSIPASQVDQIEGQKPSENSWIPFWKGRSNISHRKVNPSNLAWGEKISDISSGLEHCLLLTSKGRVFSAASGTEDFPTKGQLGIPGLTWTTRPEGAYDQPHEISTLRGFEIVKIVAGDYHSLVVDNQGRVFAFGDNSLGQLGFDCNPEAPTVDAPSLLAIDRLYKGTNMVPRVTDVAAGGVNSFFTVDATRIAGQGEEDPRGIGRITADTWSCGQGIWGGLGNGRWTHVQSTPTKIKALSGLFEYDEVKNAVVPIRLAHLSVGSTHMSAVMSNISHVGASDRSSEHDTNWGADVLWWGGNEYYQLGTGKRNNVNNPVYIAPLDVEADKEKGRREEHRFQITPRKKIKINGRSVSVEQRIECGRGVTAIYSGT
ncbi:mitochondrial protein-like protein Fmp25 [Hyaloscypha bicolor E]|uniref:Mitochondrial protein-like protein Fmp25 n=1 Tax=Hyaloscypha bicolor E TaxID=1095630 RepID=A0A2J6TWF3_9HELO|nr:mitochondrial protein-like protein Fmp25 [Hyaloscypha bicolor E]PMD67356.1 mitochondrial protein-like protein Fmp25 [Hyaloscypha bicolor E]